MGKLIYEGNQRIDLDDRVLEHIQFVIANKLRRNEPFFFTWREDASIVDGRASIWVHPASDLVFRFYGTRKPTLNRAWLEALAYTANSNTGLHVVPEPPDEPSSLEADL